MKSIFPSLKKPDRQERISSFMSIVGAVDTLIGGVSENGTLMLLGLFTVGLALGYRWWWKIDRTESPSPQGRRQLYLPAQSSSQPLNFDRQD
jgi:hypothetical protein